MTEPTIVQSCRARYACRSVYEIDAHLHRLTTWLACNLPAMHPGQRRAIAAAYARDIDRLLNARAMVASLDTLDEDLADLAVGLMREDDS